MHSRSPNTAAARLCLSLLALGALPAHAEDVYPFDEVSRMIEPKGRVTCPKVDLVVHKGSAVGWSSPLRVNAAFQERLKAFEAVVAAVGKRVLGRAPRVMTHLGSFYCRRIRAYPSYISEHGLGNAIDVAGFVFPGLKAAEAKRSTLPKRWRRRGTITVLGHWKDEGPAGEFLRALAAELETRPDIFRVMLGPGFPGHDNHFHFDLSPYRFIQWSGLDAETLDMSGLTDHPSRHVADAAHRANRPR